jgi:hypothetical protein
LEKQANGDSIAKLGGKEVVAKFMGKWGVCWGAADGMTGVLVWQDCEVVG